MQSTDIQAAKRPSKKLPNVVTSFHKAGYEKYGKRFVESWLRYWPASIRLTIFYEGDESDFEMVEGVSWRPIEEVEFLTDYLNALKPFPIMSGLVGESYNINYDARMARKVFMEVYIARKYGGKVFWIDADSVTVKSVPESFLDSCLPDDKFSCYLGRDGWYFTESGFIGFNANHPIAEDFFRNYVHTFVTGTIFTQSPTYDEHGRYVMGGWHDCIGYDSIRFLASQRGHEGAFKNLAAHVPKGHMHPLQISAPGEYLHHLKGNRKETGELKPEDTLGSVAAVG